MESVFVFIKMKRYSIEIILKPAKIFVCVYYTQLVFSLSEFN